MPTSNSRFTELLLTHYTVEELYGKSIKDKRGGDNNIHSWDIEYKGAITPRQIELLNKMLKERRKKKWAEIYGIDWMDGMPLTVEFIRSFFDDPDLEAMLEDLVNKKYVVKEHPKKKVGKDYRFPNISMSSAYKQCGNSVVVPVIRRIAENIMKVMSGKDE